MSLSSLLSCVSLCKMPHPVVVHAKSRLIQRIVTCDPSRLRDSEQICVHLLNPLITGLSSRGLSSAQFDDVLSSVRILLDIVEQLRYENEDHKHFNEMSSLG